MINKLRKSLLNSNLLMQKGGFFNPLLDVKSEIEDNKQEFKKLLLEYVKNPFNRENNKIIKELNREFSLMVKHIKIEQKTRFANA
jgi:CRISPR/Cas system CMR subunit Cmr6 (Cas7 group RAMP superfamily)